VSSALCGLPLCVCTPRERRACALLLPPAGDEQVPPPTTHAPGLTHWGVAAEHHIFNLAALRHAAEAGELPLDFIHGFGRILGKAM